MGTDRTQQARRLPVGDGHVVVWVDVDETTLTAVQRAALADLHDALSGLAGAGKPLRVVPGPRRSSWR